RLGHGWWGRVAACLGRPVSTIRGWWRRLAANAEPLRVTFTVGLHTAALDAPPVLMSTGSPVGDVVAALAAMAAAVRRLLPAAVRVAPVWQGAAAVTNGGLLRPTPPSRILQHVGA